MDGVAGCKIYSLKLILFSAIPDCLLYELACVTVSFFWVSSQVQGYLLVVLGHGPWVWVRSDAMQPSPTTLSPTAYLGEINKATIFGCRPPGHQLLTGYPPV